MDREHLKYKINLVKASIGLVDGLIENTPDNDPLNPEEEELIIAVLVAMGALCNRTSHIMMEGDDNDKNNG